MWISTHCPGRGPFPSVQGAPPIGSPGPSDPDDLALARAALHVLGSPQQGEQQGRDPQHGPQDSHAGLLLSGMLRSALLLPPVRRINTLSKGSATLHSA